jgi:hypothetical protein
MTVTYPIIPPEENDLLDPAWGADITEAVNDHQDRTTELEGGSYIGEDTEATTSASSTGSEAFSGATVTWTADSASRYKFTAVGTYASTVLGDVPRFRIRVQSGSSVTSSGTQLKIMTVRVEVANSGTPFSLIATVTGLSGQYTAGISLQRIAGTGTVTINSNSTDETFFLVERVAFA